MARSRFLPSARRKTSPAAILMLFVVGAVCAAGAMVGFLFRSSSTNGDWQILVIYGLLSGGVAGTGAILLLLDWFEEKNEEHNWSTRLCALGLAYQPGVLESVLEPFLDLPLFCFGGADRRFAGWLGHGVLEGHELLVLNYRYVGLLRTRSRTRYPFGGFQTIALFPCVELPDFHLAPQQTDWTIHWPDWARVLDVGPIVCVIGPSDDASVIRSHDDVAVLRLFTEDRLRQLGDPSGWTIESLGGRMLIYLHDDLMIVDELPHFVYRVIDIVRVLTAPAEESALPAVDVRVKPGRS